MTKNPRGFASDNYAGVHPEIMAAIVAAYGIKEGNVVGHDDIAPIRKVDPGPAYPMARVKSIAFGRAGK